MRTIVSRVATLEALRRAQIAACTDADLPGLCASLDRRYGPGTGAFLWDYMDQSMSLAEVEALHAGDRQLAQRVWTAYDLWKETQ